MSDVMTVPRVSAEQAVIASILLDARVMRSVATEVVPADFEDLRLGDMFGQMAMMFGRQEPIDVLTVGDRLGSWGVRGISEIDLHNWISATPSAAHASSYARAIREAAVRRGMREVATRMINEADHDPSIALSHGIDGLKQLSEGARTVRASAKLLGDVLLDDLGDDDYDWVIPNLLERYDRLLLTGVEGGGKSTLVRQMAVMTSAGLHPFTFFPTEPKNVLVIDAENTEKQWRRAVRGLTKNAALRGKRNPADAMGLWCTSRLDLTKDSDLGEVHRLVDEWKPDVLFIGPLYRLIPRAVNSDDDAAPLLAALDTIRDRGVAMVIEAHAGHSVGAGGERDLRPRGSAALLGWPEFGLGLRVDKSGRSSNEFQLIRWRGDRDQRKWPTRISRGISDWPWTPTVM